MRKTKILFFDFSEIFRKATAAVVPAAGGTGGDGDNANRITYDEFAILVRRIDRMEYSIGNIVSRVR